VDVQDAGDRSVVLGRERQAWWRQADGGENDDGGREGRRQEEQLLRD